MNSEHRKPEADEPLATGPTDMPTIDDVEGHGLLNEGFQKPPATSRNADRNPNQGCRNPGRTHPNRRENR